MAPKKPPKKLSNAVVVDHTALLPPQDDVEEADASMRELDDDHQQQPQEKHGQDVDMELPTLPSTSHLEVPKFNISTYDFSPLVTSPSPLSLSRAGQVMLVTRGQIDILTPANGYQCDQLVVQSGAIANMTTNAATSKGKERASEDDPIPLPMFRTTITIEKKDIIEWQGWTNETHVVSAASGSMEHFWRHAVWSPLGLGPLGGCVLAALSNNNEVLVFEPSKNVHKSQWIETFDIGSALIQLLIPEEEVTIEAQRKVETAEDRRQIAVTLWECQSTAIAWSAAVEGLLDDASILAVGHKSGHISLWRRNSSGDMIILHRYRMCSNASWITLLSWSEWRSAQTAQGQYATCLLSVAEGNGRIWVVEIMQHLDSGLGSDSVTASEPVQICERDQSAPTQLKWIVNGSPLPTLVYTKVGTVTFVDLDSNAAEDRTSNIQLHSSSVLELPAQGDWIGTTPCAPCCGIAWFTSPQLLVISLESSAFYVLVKINAHWKFVDLDEDQEENISMSSTTSATATMIIRQVFLKTFRQTTVAKFKKAEASASEPTWKKGARSLALTEFGEDGEIGWLFENVSPDRMNYKALGNLRTQFVVIPILGDVGGQQHYDRLQEILKHAPDPLKCSPLAILRSFLQYASDSMTDSTWTSSILDLLSADLPALGSPTISGVANGVEASSAIASALYFDSNLNSLRYKEIVARYFVRQGKGTKDLKKRASEIHAVLARTIVNLVITRLGNVFSAAQSHLSPAELAISGRILIASASLPAETEGEQEELPPPDAFSFSLSGSETCHACTAPIALTNARKATCENGHIWERCSITLKVVDTVIIRTCVGCERKALLALEDDQEKEKIGDDREEDVTIVDAILKGCKACLYCGCSWMRIR